MAVDVIVTARRQVNTAGVVLTGYNSIPNQNNESVASFADTNTSASDVSVNVRVTLTNTSNTAKAQEAAQNIAAAVAAIVAEATKLPSSTVISLPGGKSTTVGNLLDDIRATKFVVTDNANFGNGGVAAADKGTMTDTLYYGAFAEGTGMNSYSNSHFNGQGVIGIILHELGHLSTAGDSNYAAEYAKFGREQAERKTGNTAFFGSNYSTDNELFSFGYGSSVAATLSIPLSTFTGLATASYDPDYFRGADAVYQQNRDEIGW
jgi:hypothetical protein